MYQMITTHINVIWALVMRQFRLSCNGAGGWLKFLMTPLRTVVLFIFIRGIMFASLRDQRGMLHLVLGLLMYGMFTRIIVDCRVANKFGVGVYMFPRVTPLDVFISKTIAFGYVYGSLALVLGLCVGWYWGHIDLTNWEYALIGWALLAFFSLGAGVFINAVSEYYPFMNAVFTILIAPLFLLSGVIADVTNMNIFIQEMSKWNPIAIGLQLVRYGFGIHSPEDYLNFACVAIWGVTLFSLGILVGRHVWKAKTV